MPVIATTSGTTGTPKVMEFTEELLKARTELTALGKGAKIAECKVVHVAYTPSSSAFKKFEEWGNLNGKKIIGLIQYDKIVETFEKEGVDAIDGAPGYLVSVAKLFEAKGKTAGLKQAITARSKLNRSDAIYIQKWLSPNLQVCYGTSETSQVSSGTAEEIADIEGCVGFILPGIQVEIVEGDVIRIKTPVMITEYVDNPVETAKHFKDGWFYPGDRGYITKDNRLVITKNR